MFLFQLCVQVETVMDVNVQLLNCSTSVGQGEVIRRRRTTMESVGESNFSFFVDDEIASGEQRQVKARSPLLSRAKRLAEKAIREVQSASGTAYAGSPFGKQGCSTILAT